MSAASRLRVVAAALVVTGSATMAMATGSVAVPIPVISEEPAAATTAESAHAEPKAPTFQPGDTLTIKEAGGPAPTLPMPSLRVQEARLTGQPRVTIPALDASLRMVASGSTPTAMVVPSGLERIGWLASTAPPGASRGTTLLATHRDSTTASGPLAKVKRLTRGDRIVVHAFNGERRAFKVTSKRTYDRTALPADIFAPYGPRRLALLTCGGRLGVGQDGRTLHWQQNVVVIAVPVGSSRR